MPVKEFNGRRTTVRSPKVTAIPADMGAECALGRKLSKVLANPKLDYNERLYFRTGLAMLADAVEIDISHPDLVEGFWELMVFAMSGMQPNRVARVRRREIEERLARFEMVPTTSGYDYKLKRRPLTLAEMGLSLTDKGKALIDEPNDTEVQAAKRRSQLRVIQGGSK